MLIYKYHPSVVTVSGAWSGNTARLNGGLCRQVYVKPASSDTTFTVEIIDKDDISVRTFEGCTLVSDFTAFFVEGIYTVSISSASADEAFEVMLCINDA